VNVSSSAHKGATIDFDDLQGERGYKGSKAYSQSKLAQILFTVEYGRRLAGTGVTVNAVHPGVIKTNLGADGSSAVVRFVRMFFKSPAKGAETPIFLVASPTVANLSGQYFANRQVTVPSRQAQDPAVARRLYDVSVKLAGLGADEVRGTPS
jgi:NAD(P)-dependent dehydrogenase (short-subunit alcohol dehydrogenase family)